MHLRAALVPPTPLAEALVSVVAAVEVPAAPVPEPPPARGLFRRRQVAVEPVEPTEGPLPQLDLLPTDQLQIPLCSFGNLTTEEVDRLRRALAEISSGLPTPTVQAAGGTALEFPGDRSVWAKLEGDIDGLWAVFRGINEGVERLGFFLDRRSFRPWLAVGTINDETSASYLENVVAALDAHRGDPWLVDGVSLMKLALTGRPPRSTELVCVPLGE
jgi:2'-5' RNA ligase